MQEAVRLQLRFNLEGLIRYATRHLPAAVPRRVVMRFARHDGHPTLVAEDQANVELLVRPLNDIQLQATEFFTALEHLFCANDELNALLSKDGTDGVSLALPAFVVRMLVAYFAKTDGRIVFDQLSFDDIVEELVAEIDAPGWRWRRRTPLHNFTVPENAPQRLKIADGIVIRPLENGERDEWHNGMFTERLHWASLANVTHVIESIYERPRHDVIDIAPAVSEDDVLFVLRMSGSDVASFDLTEQRLMSVWLVSIHFPNFRLAVPLLEEKLVFSAAVQERFVRMYATYRQLKHNRAFAFAVRRYNDGCARTLEDDRVVDFWVAAEAMFTARNDPRDENLRLRLSARLAAFVEPDHDLQAECFAEIYESYKIRSLIVHGSLRRNIERSDVELIRPYVKRAFQRIMSDAHLPDVRVLYP